jgi:hypothetical protein
MNTSRRSFIKKGDLAVAAATLIDRPSFAGHAKNDPVGMQLYSIREEMKTDPL